MTQELMTVESLKVDLFREQYKQLTSFLGDEDKARKFLGSVAYCFSSVPKLAECDKASVVSSFMKIAEYNLFPSTVSGEAYVLPYYNGKTKRNEAQFQLGYKGIITLLYRAGVSSIYSDIARSNDEIEVLGGTDPGINHKYSLGNRGDPIGAYAVATLNGEKIFKYMGKDEILAFRKFSKSASGDFAKYSPWDPSNDPELNMWKKTVIKQLAKVLPQNEILAKVIYDDNEDGDIAEYVRKSVRDKSASDGWMRMANLLWSPSPAVVPNANETEDGDTE